MALRVVCALALAASAVACPSGFATCGNKCCDSSTQTVCAGDTRGDQRCNHDSTHRVCAKIGDPGTSFWTHTGQSKWCGTRLNYNLQYSPHGHDVACPLSNPTWCICKWATASWIKGEGCGSGINIDCDATDICRTQQGLFFSYSDFDVNLAPARACIPQKCASKWNACAAANGVTGSGSVNNAANTQESSSQSSGGASAGAIGGMGAGVVLVSVGAVLTYMRVMRKRTLTPAADAKEATLDAQPVAVAQPIENPAAKV